MGQDQRFAKDQSFKNFAESARKGFCFLALILTACAGKKPVPPELNVAKTAAVRSLSISSTLGVKLTSEGESYQPVLSAEGNEILFLSSRPETHGQPQVYLYNLELLNERRVTYQDGQCDSPVFVKKSGNIVYASTTDEIKERPALLQKNASAEFPSELYLSDINGSSIRRLTRHPGFDGNPVDRPDKANSIYFSQEHQGVKRILQINLVSTQSIPILQKKDVSVEDFRPSPNGMKWIWRESKKDSADSSVWIAEKSLAKAQAVAWPSGRYQDFSWIDDNRLLLSAKLTKEKYFHLLSYDLEKKCLREVLADKSDLSSPQLTPNQKSLIFVSNDDGTRQLYLRTITLDWSSACLNKDAVTTTTTLPTMTTTTLLKK
jgi:Tol biopolymer transport system component